MNNLEIFNLDLSTGKDLPKNIYAIKVLNADNNTTFEIAIVHDGYCLKGDNDHDESNLGEYLCNLEYKLIDNYFKTNKIKKPKSYYSICEIVTNDLGELYRYARIANT